MTMKQLTVLTGNSAIHLGTVLWHLSSQGIDIRAHCLVDNGDGYCKLRLVVSEPDKAVDILQEKNLAAVVNDIVIVETDDQPGGLSRMLKLFEGDDIAIQYTYTAASDLPGIAEMVFRFSDNARAIVVLKENGINVLE